MISWLAALFLSWAVSSAERVAIVDGSSADEDSSHRCARRSSLGGDAMPDEIVVDAETAKAGIRCCSGKDGRYDLCPRDVSDVDGEKQRCAEYTYEEAEAVCASKGKSLCTLQQLRENLDDPKQISNKVCGNAYKHVWTKTQCMPLQTPANLPQSGWPKMYMVNVKTSAVISEIGWGQVFNIDQLRGVSSSDDLTIVVYVPPRRGSSVSIRIENAVFENVDTSDFEQTKLDALYVPPGCTLGINETCAVQDWVERDAEDGFSLNGVDCLTGRYKGGGPLSTGVGKGEFAIRLVIGDITVSRKFSVFERSDMIYAPEIVQSDLVLHVAPYAVMPTRDYGRKGPFDYDGYPAYIETFRVNMIIPWGDFVYFCTEMSGMVYKVSGKVPPAARTADLKKQARSPWFDVYQALWDQTAPGSGNEPQRTMDLVHHQHSGFRVMVHHPDFTDDEMGRGTGYVYTAHMEMRPGTTIDSETGIRYCPDDSEDMIKYVNGKWKYTSIFEEGKADPQHACGEAVVVEWYFDKDKLQKSYRQLIRMTYGQSGLSRAEYDHPIKQMRFRPQTTELWIESGDGSVDSTTVGGGQKKNAYGKILRIDVAGTEGTSNFNVNIPADNYVFLHPESGMPEEVCGVGFRNPHSVCFVKSPLSPYYQKAIMFDGGRDNAEEINVMDDCSDNYGWSVREGVRSQYDFSGGVHTSNGPLPEDDARFGFRYPAAFFGHHGEGGEAYNQQCGVGGFVIENGSELDGKFFSTNFPASAEVYFSEVEELMGASQFQPNLQQAAMNQVSFATYEKPRDYLVGKNPVRVDPTFHEVAESKWVEFDFVQEDPPSDEFLLEEKTRTDVRIAEGAFGEMLLISKHFGVVFTVMNSMPPNVNYKPRENALETEFEMLKSPSGEKFMTLCPDGQATRISLADLPNGLIAFQATNLVAPATVKIAGHESLAMEERVEGVAPITFYGDNSGYFVGRFSKDVEPGTYVLSAKGQSCRLIISE